jgi:hypothetical protein
VLEWFYIGHEYSGVLPRAWHDVEVIVAWTVVTTILLVHRPGRPWHDAHATVSAQALLGALHGLTFPVADLRRWIPEGASIGDSVGAILANYPLPFWVAVVSLFAASLPGYRRLPTPETLDRAGRVADRPPVAEVSALHGAPPPAER